MSLSRGLDILEYLAQTRQPISADTLADTLNIPRATCFRIIKKLLQSGYIRKSDDGKGYLLGLKILTLSSTVMDQLDLRLIVRDALKKLLALSNETVELAIFDPPDMLFIDKLESPEAMRIFAQPGTRHKALHSMAPGKVILAFADENFTHKYLQRKLEKNTEKTITNPNLLKNQLKQIRKHLYAFDDQETRIGVRRFAAPIFDHTGKFAATIGFAGPTIRLPLKDKSHFADCVIQSAKYATELLSGNWPM